MGKTGAEHCRFQFFFTLCLVALLSNRKCCLMELKNFKQKKLLPSCFFPRFPSFTTDARYIGVFDGQTVSVFDEDAIHYIYTEGNFGKGSLSKSAPASLDIVGDTPEVMMEQQWQNQMKWKTDCETQVISENSNYYQHKMFASSVQNFLNFALSNSIQNPSNEPKKAENLIECGNDQIVYFERPLPHKSKNDSNLDPVKNMVEDILQTGKMKESKSTKIKVIKPVLVLENIEDCLNADKFEITNLKITLKKKLLSRREYLKLSLQEAFFLFFALGCLKILSKKGAEIKVEDLWRNFCEIENNFIAKYICYHHYRSYGWTVRSGLKFGGDYLLYKIGPNYYHANYLVWISDVKKKKMCWNEFLTLNRLMETCNKDLLLCEIFGPEIEERSSVDFLKEFSILELTTKRWIPSEERERTNL